MPSLTPDYVLHRLPEEIAAAARAQGVRDEDCLFSMWSDLALDGTVHTVWLVVTKTQLLVLDPESKDGKPVGGPFTLKAIEKVRAFQTVGSTFLQVMVDGLYVSVVRCSNRRREPLSRVRVQLEKMVEGGEFQPEAFAKPSEQVCPTCGLPLVSKDADCPKCRQHHGLMLRSLGMMRPYTSAIVLVLCLMIAGVTLDLVPAQLTRMLVDKVLSPPAGQVGRIDLLPWILLGLVGISATRCLLNVGIGRVSSIVGTRITKELRQRLEEKLLGLSVEYYDRHSVGSLMSRVLYDVDYFQGFVAQVAHGFLLNLMLVLGIGVMLFVMNWKLAILVLLPVPFVILGTFFYWKHIYPRYYRFWDSQSKMAQLLSGLLSGVRLVKSFGQEEREHRRFDQCATYTQQSRRSLEIGASTFNPIMGFVFGLGGLIVWYAGGRLVFEGHITLGTLMAFFSYLGMFYSPISALSMFSNWVTGFLSAAQRVFEILDSKAALKESPNPLPLPEMKGAIEFRNVTFGYDPYTPILKNVSLKINAGQFIGIVGKSGSGKTTLVNLICRFYDCQQGQVLVDGLNVQDIKTEDLHRQIGLVLQEPFLFRASIAENIAYGKPDAAPLEIMDAARAGNAHDFICQRAGAYDRKLGERGAGLSGGERQRVSIGRALLCNPRILILDEATSSVDTESEQEIQKSLAQLSRGRTTIAIAHRLSTLKNADFIYVIDEGRIAESGSHEQLMAMENGIYHKLVRIQTELTRLEV